METGCFFFFCHGLHQQVTLLVFVEVEGLLSTAERSLVLSMPMFLFQNTISRNKRTFAQKQGSLLLCGDQENSEMK